MSGSGFRDWGLGFKVFWLSALVFFGLGVGARSNGTERIWSKVFFFFGRRSGLSDSLNPRGARDPIIGFGIVVL